MNREERRRFNKRNKTNYTKQDFEAYEIAQQIRMGNLNLNNLDIENPFITIDNEEFVPEGRETKLDTDRILSRKEYETVPMYRKWVKEHKDVIFHVTRETAKSSLVALAEDVKEWNDNPETEKRQPWLFDIFSDLLFLDENGKWDTLKTTLQTDGLLEK